MLRVMTWNIKTGVGNDPDDPGARVPSDLERVARVIRSVDPDVVALQEVDRNRERTSGVDQPATLASLLGMEYRYGPNLVDHEGEYGVATLSRLPIVDWSHDLLPGADGWEPRGVVEVVIDAPGVGHVCVLNTHLQVAFGHGEEEAYRQRRESVSLIADRIRKSSSPAVLMGDFNSEPGVEELEGFTFLTDAWDAVGEEASGATFPATPFEDPSIRIDAIFSTEEWRVGMCRILRTEETTLASDHYPLVAELHHL